MSGPDASTTTPIVKVLNNNVVVTVDTAGREQILMGRGLGFQMRPGQSVDTARIEKTFVLDAGAEGERNRRIVAEAPYPVVEAVTRAIDDAERRLGRDLGRHVAFGVIDHVQYVLERLDEGIRIPTAAMPQLRILHPDEFGAAETMATSIGAALGRPMPAEEAVFLAMHLLNATRTAPGTSAAESFRRVQRVVETVERGLDVTLDPDAPGYVRFVLHVQFLLQRMATRSLLAADDSSFYEFARRSYPLAHGIAVEVATTITRDGAGLADGAELTQEELLYLTVHIERLRSQLERAAEIDADAGIAAEAEIASGAADDEMLR